ncbi:platelet glycoprotein IX-like [Pelobates fuscus]|uniref:platelet glycoprotein IX-like n=1 Tax=Pelobates fuscus TaxID=191477 RepID=UPI002FE4BBA1
MLFCLVLILLWILFPKTINGNLCPGKCKCTNVTVDTLRMDCRLQNLSEIPVIPISTEELYLQQNQITTIPPGVFDKLMNLKKFNLSSNPLHCDCKILYLKLWLDDRKLDIDNSTICSTPAMLHGMPVSQLKPCSRPHTCFDFLAKDTFLYISLFLLFSLLIVCLKKIKLMQFRLNVTDNDIMFRTHQSLRISLKKRRFNHRYKNA